MNPSSQSITDSQRSGRILFWCALTLMAIFLGSIVLDTYISEEYGILECIEAGIIYLLALLWIARCSSKALNSAKGCLGILLVFCLGSLCVVIPILIAMNVVHISDYLTLETPYSLLRLAASGFVYWVFFFSTSAKSYFSYRQSAWRACAHSQGATNEI